MGVSMQGTRLCQAKTVHAWTEEPERHKTTRTVQYARDTTCTLQNMHTARHASSKPSTVCTIAHLLLELDPEPLLKGVVHTGDLLRVSLLHAVKL